MLLYKIKKQKNIYQLVEEENAGCRGSGLIEDVSDIGLALTEPHGQKLGALDGYEVSLALVGDGFSQQSFTCSRRIKLLNPKNCIVQNKFFLIIKNTDQC